MAIAFSLKDVLNKSSVVSVCQRDLSVIQLMLQTAVEQAQQQFIGQTGRVMQLVFTLHHCTESTVQTPNILYIYQGICVH